MNMAEHGLNANSLLVGSLLKQLEDDAAMNGMLNWDANLKPVTPQAALEEHKNAQQAASKDSSQSMLCFQSLVEKRKA